MTGHRALAQELQAADELVHRADAEARHDFAHFLGDGVEEVDDVFWLALEFRAQIFVLRGDADRAGVRVALAHVNAADGDERGGAEVEFLRAEHARRGRCRGRCACRRRCAASRDSRRPLSMRTCCASATPSSHGAAGVLDRGQRRGAGAAFVAGDEDDVGVRLGHAGGDGADAGFGDELHADPGARVHLLQVVDELRQILDASRCRGAAAGEMSITPGIAVAEPGDDARSPCGREAGRLRRASRPGPS